MGLERRAKQSSPACVAVAIVLVGVGCLKEQAVLVRTSPDGAVVSLPPSRQSEGGALRIEPAFATVMLGLAGSARASQKFQARLIVDGAVPVPPITWLVDTEHSDYVSIDPSGLATVSALYEGDALIVAQVGSQSATARLKVKLGITELASGISPQSNARWTGPIDPDRAPDVLYPLLNTLLPGNLPSLPIHFRPRAETSLYEIAFENERTDVRLYLPCLRRAGGCEYEIQGPLWRALVDANRGHSLTLTMRAMDAIDPGVGVSEPRVLSIALTDLTGELHYWTTTGIPAPMRWNVAQSERTVPERAARLEGAEACVGCHATSPDGKRAVVMTGPAGGLGRSFLYDFAERSYSPINRALQAASFSPDGALFVGVPSSPPSTGPKDLSIFNGKTGMETGALRLLGMRAAHPDWSPDGTRIAFCAVDTRGVYPDHRPGQGSIAFVERDGQDWRSPRTVMGALPGRNFHSPGFSPDSRLVAFVESICDAENYGPSCDADSDPVTRLWLAPVPMVTDGVPARPLDIVNRAGPDDRVAGLGLSAPRFHPRVAVASPGRRVFWLVFSSIRRFGLRTPPAGERLGAWGTWLWAAAVDPNAFQSGREPSFAPFLLPWQDLTTSNHNPQWSVKD